MGALLTASSADLDGIYAPFLAHRCLLHHPSEGDSHLIPLVVSELEAILEDRVSADLLSEDSIRDWLDTRAFELDLFDSIPGITTTEAARGAVQDICLMGVGSHAVFSFECPKWIKEIADDKGKGGT